MSDDAKLEIVLSGIGEAILRRKPGAMYAREDFAAWMSKELRGAMHPAELNELDADADSFVLRAQAKVRLQTIEARVPAAQLNIVSAEVRGTPRQIREIAAERRIAPLLDLPVAAGVGRAIFDEPCDTWVELPKGVPRGEYVSLRITGDSMEPALSAGDVILVKTGSEVAPDTMVVANRGEDGCVVKYVASVEPERIELASLNPAYPPFFVPRDGHSIIGTVISRFHRM